MLAFELIPVKDYGRLGIAMEAECRHCGRKRVIHGGLLPRVFSQEDRLNNERLEARLSNRVYCGGCKQRDPILRLVQIVD